MGGVSGFWQASGGSSGAAKWVRWGRPRGLYMRTSADILRVESVGAMECTYVRDVVGGTHYRVATHCDAQWPASPSPSALFVYEGARMQMCLACCRS